MPRYFPFFELESTTGWTAWTEGTALSLEAADTVADDALVDARPPAPTGTEYTGIVEVVPVDARTRTTTDQHDTTSENPPA